MDSFMLEGWTPIILIGIVFAIVIFLVSRKVSRKTLFKISNILSLICLIVISYSILIIGGWEGMGLGIFTFSTFIGIWIGTVIGIGNKKENI